MALTPAEKQRAYRKRKALGNAYAVTMVRQDAQKLGNQEEVEELFDELWEIGGLKLVEKTAVLMYGVTSMAVVLRDMYPDLYGHRPGPEG